MHTPQRIALLAATFLLAAAVPEGFGAPERATTQMRLEDPAIVQALKSLDRPKGPGNFQKAFGVKCKSDLPSAFYEPCRDEMDLLAKTRAPVDNELLRRARVDKRLRVRYRAARILAERGDDCVVPVLLEMTASPDVEERYLGWDLYYSALHDRTLPRPQEISNALARYRRETDPEVFEVIEEFFAKARNTAAVKPLLQRVRKDPKASTAIWALGEIGDPAAVPAIIDAYKAYDGPPGHTHFEALGKLATPEAVDFLIEHLDSPWVPRALAEAKSARALPALKAHLKKLVAKSSEYDERVNTDTRIAIVQLSHKDPREPLLALAENPRESTSIRSHALCTLRSYDVTSLEPRILALYKRERNWEVNNLCIPLLEDSEAAGVTEAMTEYALEREGSLQSGLLIDALNKRLGTSFHHMEALQRHLRALKKRQGGR